jgi:hypothetical protein
MSAILSLGSLNVKNFGVKGDNSTDDANAIFACFQRALAMGGAEIFFPPGIYVTSTLLLVDYLYLRGVPGATTLKAKAGTDQRIIKHKITDGDGVLNWLGLEGLIFDGNVANQPRVNAASALDLENLRSFRARDCVFKNASGYGMALQAGTNAVPGTQEDTYIENCQFLDNGIGSLTSETYDGLDIKYSRRTTIIGCHAKGNYDKGFDVRGREVAMINCTATDNTTWGFGVGDNIDLPANEPSEVVMTGCHSQGSGRDGVVVYQLATAGGRVTLTDNVVRDSGESGLNLNNATSVSTVTVSGGEYSANGVHGINVENVGKLRVKGADVEGNVGSGIKTKASGIYVGAAASLSNNGRYGIENANGATGHSIDPSVIREGNTLGPNN